ncbi:MAG: SoxR reducing system RseC family protein [Bacteroidaceae bacterium]|nr:SoxR reducing system RseC family protein [Bacteroidaceae bacterium]
MISHEGIVKAVERDVVRVEILQLSACAHCEVSGHCNASESKEKIIDAETADAALYKIGDKVVVMAYNKVGMLAVLYGAVLPMLVVMAGVISAAYIINDEMSAIVIGLCTLGVYYAMLYLLRSKLKKQLRFEIMKR